MTKLELTISGSSLECVDYDDLTAEILGIPPLFSNSQQRERPLIGDVLADKHELALLQGALDQLLAVGDSQLEQQQQQQQQQPKKKKNSFQTLNLVFVAPNAEQSALPSDRCPLTGVFSSPMTAFHMAGQLHISCFAHVQRIPPQRKDDNNYDQSDMVKSDRNSEVKDEVLFKITALEYSREHRAQVLQQEFGSWLLEEHIEKAVIATAIDGTVVFWNRFASTLYGYDKEFAMGKEIRTLISTEMSREQGNEMMKRLAEGEHFSSMYKAGRADGTDFIAHATTTPIMDNNNAQVQFLVGVSADYSQLHSVMTKLEELNANLEKEVVARTEQLLAREKHVRMIGAAMKESDTGVIITDDSYKITWCNDAVSRMLGLQKRMVLGMKPWELPLQQESKHQKQKKQKEEDGSSNAGDSTNTNNDSSLSAVGDMDDDDDNASSLETYFMQEKAFNEREIVLHHYKFKSHLMDEDNEVDAILREISASVNSSRRNSNSNSNPDLEVGTDASFSNDNVLGTPAFAATTTATDEIGATATERRPTMPAICFKLDSPMPLHIMIGVQAMPPDDVIKIVPRRSASARYSSYSPAELHLLSGTSLNQSQGTHSNRVEDSGASSCSAPIRSSSEPPPKTTDQPQNISTEKAPHKEMPDRTTSDISTSSNASYSSMQFMITLRDITAERKAEEAQLIAERASAANEAKTQMMQMLSHELRTPLQGIMGVASTSMMDIEEADGMSNSSSNSKDKDKDTGVKGSMYDSLSTILASSRLLLTLINNTLDTRKINADMMQKIELGNVSMMACIRDSFQYCGPFATINEAILELSGTDGSKVLLPHILNSSSSKSDLMADILKKKYNVVGNRLRLEQVIVNLLSNGIKYTTPGTKVIASVRNSSLAKVLEDIKGAPSSSLKFLTEDYIKELDELAAGKNIDVTVFSVRDHGKGIPPGEYGKVFGEFQQLDASAEKDRKYEGGKTDACQSSGSGLGLNLAMKFVNMMNGHIWFQNTTDGKGGVTFNFFLHRSRQLRGKQRSSSTETIESKMNDSSGRSEDSFTNRVDDAGLQEKTSRFRVLVIDDSMINLKVLARMMTRIKVQHCETALSGAAALEYLEPIRNDPTLVPNLILCDLQMPGMDGYELMGHLREMNICSSPIIMACSADWGSETERKCHDVGFDGLLRKPITVTYMKDFLVKTKLNQ